MSAQAAGLDVRAELSVAGPDRPDLPAGSLRLADTLTTLCRSGDAAVRAKAEALVQHLQRESRAEAARAGALHPPARRVEPAAPPRAAAERESGGPAGSPAALLERVRSSDRADVVAALRELAHMALKEEQRWGLLRCTGLFRRLLELMVDGSEKGEAGVPSRRLAAKTLAHMGTTSAIRSAQGPLC